MKNMQLKLKYQKILYASYYIRHCAEEVYQNLESVSKHEKVHKREEYNPDCSTIQFFNSFCFAVQKEDCKARPF
jgi:hypothetical protein